MGSKYKTKFPMARIKKIMQIDEEVGKVAQTTPIVISKALELFLQRIIDAAAKESMSSSRKISKAVLKRTILKTEELDFLQVLVKDISDVDERETTPPASPAKKRGTPQRKTHNDTEQASYPNGLDQDEDDPEEGPFVKKSKSKDGLSQMRISALVED